VAKPSIFSKDYQRRMRRRRAGFAVLIVAAVIVAAVAFITGKNYLSKNNQQQANNTSSTTSTDKTTTDKTTTETKTTETPKEEGIEFKLADGTSLMAVYKMKDTVKDFQYVTPKEKNVYFDINPPGDKIVVFDSGAQSMILIDTTGKVQDITSQVYTSSNGTAYKKANVLNSYKGYIWCSSPVFISDTKVAYISQLPYFQKDTEYVWIVDVTTGKNTKINNAYSGEKITFGELGSKGLPMNIDGSVYYITATGSVVK
jgi:hypothetical protein